MDGLYSSNPNKYFVTILIAIILLEFIIIATQSIGSFMQGYLNPGELGFIQSEQIDYQSQIDELNLQIDDLEQNNLTLEAQNISLTNKIKELTADKTPTPIPR